MGHRKVSLSQLSGRGYLIREDLPCGRVPFMNGVDSINLTDFLRLHYVKTEVQRTVGSMTGKPVSKNRLCWRGGAAFGALFLTLLLSSFQSVAAETKKARLSHKELKALIANAKTPEDHQKLATYYRQEGERLGQRSREHEELAAVYEKRPKMDAGRISGWDREPFIAIVSPNSTPKKQTRRKPWRECMS